jgi:hypothetical protein
VRNVKVGRSRQQVAVRNQVEVYVNGSKGFAVVGEGGCVEFML